MGLFDKWEHKGSIYQRKTDWDTLGPIIFAVVILILIGVFS